MHRRYRHEGRIPRGRHSGTRSIPLLHRSIPGGFPASLSFGRPSPLRRSAWVRSTSGFTSLKAQRRTGSRRGSGCTFAGALLSGLALGHSSLKSSTHAKSYVKKKLFES
ncbi:MAG: bifunctional hydroxymethylpyrimidine kinase/phosphomethylpyrimidine kinase [Deltaproteobacteria bacterium]|nr:bifunctional hydroxymethylpyrimidine kinase/phosphomethylpyrimidine kinase [Deltaproteobacteria bacterium]